MLSSEFIRNQPNNSYSEQQLEDRVVQTEEIARNLGLDPFPTHFSLVSAETMYELAGYGIPGRFSHWTHGRNYHQLKTMYDYGLSKIYELVINANPAHAFLLKNNPLLQNTAVVAHALAHVDFFKHNSAFNDTNRNMLESTYLNAQRFRDYEFEHGLDKVERMIDTVMSIDDQIDHPSEFQKLEKSEYAAQNRERFAADRRKKTYKTSEYDWLFEIGEKKEDKLQERAPLPAVEEQDLVWFIANYSKNLEDWQRDIALSIRDEMYYFFPLTQTKIMNEGWAAFWHLRIMRELGEKGFVSSGELIEFGKMHSSVIEFSKGMGGRLNPYANGLAIWEDILRLGEGRPHPDKGKQKNWRGEELDPAQFKGRDSYNIFWVRENVQSDRSFIDQYLTDYLVDELDLYMYRKEGDKWVIAEKTLEKIKEGLGRAFSRPVVKIGIGGLDYNNRGELYLKHSWEGRDLDRRYAEGVLRSINYLWGNPVYLETIIDGDKILMSTQDGAEIEIKKP